MLDRACRDGGLVRGAVARGVEIDYIDSLMGGGFKINNPNASSTCGCGKSFS